MNCKTNAYEIQLTEDLMLYDEAIYLRTATVPFNLNQHTIDGVGMVKARPYV